MGIKKTALFLLMFTFFASTAQQITEQNFPKEINGVEFTTMKLLHYTQNDDGIEAYFMMHRIGAIRSKTGPIWNGGGDPKPIYAVSALRFDHDLNLVKTDLAYLEPEDAPIGKYELLKQPVQIGRTEVLATKEEVVSRRALITRFPGLEGINQEEEADALKLPDEFYDNTLVYTNMGAKVKAFDERIYRYEKADENEKKSWFGKLWEEANEKEGPEFDHELLSDKYNMETYRGASKEQWWIRQSGPFSDPISGTVIAHNYRYMRKKFAETDPKGYYEEVVTFNADGKEANRLEIDFEKPYIYANTWHFQDKAQEYDLKTTKGVFLLYQGKPSKKDNSVTKTARKTYFVNPDGTLGWNHDFELTTEKMNLFNAQMTGDHVVLMGISWKPTLLHMHTLDETGLASHQTFTNEDPIFKAFGVTPINSGFIYREVKTLQGNDGSEIILNNMRKKISSTSMGNTTGKEMTHDEGYILTKYDQAGKLTHATRINRADNAELTKKVSLKFLKDTDNELGFLYFEPVKVTINNQETVRVALKALKINKADLKISGLKDKAPLLLDASSYFVNEAEKAVYLFADDIKNQEIKLMKYPLK